MYSDEWTAHIGQSAFFVQAGDLVRIDGKPFVPVIAIDKKTNGLLVRVDGSPEWIQVGEPIKPVKIERLYGIRLSPV